MESGRPEVDPYFDAFATPLGHLILEFNYLEIDLGRFIARLLLQDDAVAAIITGVMTFQPKLQMLHHLVAVKIDDENFREETEAILAAVGQVAAERNRLVHAEFVPSVDSDDVLRDMLFRRIKEYAKAIHAGDGKTARDLFSEVTVAHIEGLAQRAHSLAQQVRAAAEKYMDWYAENDAERARG